MNIPRTLVVAATCLVGAACQNDSVQIERFPLFAPSVKPYESGNPQGTPPGDFVYHVTVKNFGDAPSPAMFFWISAYAGCTGSAEFNVPALDPDAEWSPPPATVKSVTGCDCKKDICDGTMWFSLRTGPHVYKAGPGLIGCPGPGLAGHNTGIQLWWDKNGDLAKSTTQEYQEIASNCGEDQ
jgi:hypothetical protein